MAHEWFGRLAATADQRSSPCKPLFAAPDEGTWADIGGGHRRRTSGGDGAAQKVFLASGHSAR